MTTIYRNLVTTLTIFFVVVMQSSLGHAWGGNAHRAVCEIVWDNLTVSEQQKLKNIIKNHDVRYFSSGCAWPDWVRKKEKYIHTKYWHYQDYTGSTHEEHRDCSVGCLLQGIQMNFDLLVHTSGRDQADALYFLVHLLSDLHQPLHVGNAEDLGGNRLNVVFQNKKINLHKVWDSRLLAKGVQDIKRAILTQPDLAAEDVQWPENLILWMQESRDIARQKIYPNHTEHGIIDRAYIEKFRPISYLQLRRTSERTTIVLRRALKELP